MRAAPPVEAMLHAGRLERVLIILLHALTGAMLVGWAGLHAELGGAWVMAVCTVVVAGLMAAFGAWLAGHALPALPGSLRWDGQTWSLLAPGTAIPVGRLLVAVDLGSWILLHLHPADGGSGMWRVASAASARGSWHGLRVALSAHAGAPVQAAP
jgi:hypothetical protein